MSCIRYGPGNRRIVRKPLAAYTYANYQSLWEGRRKNATHRTLASCFLMTKEGNKFVFWYVHQSVLPSVQQKDQHNSRIAEMTPDGVITIVVSNHSQLTAGHATRIYSLTGLPCCLNASKFRNYEITVRIARSRSISLGELYHCKEASLPLVNGLEVHCGDVLNREIAVDYKRVVNRVRAKQVREKTKDLESLVGMLIKMSSPPEIKDLRTDFWRRGLNIPDKPVATTAIAEAFVGKGAASTSHWWVDSEPLFKQLVNTAAKRVIRNKYYETCGAYDRVLA